MTGWGGGSFTEYEFKKKISRDTSWFVFNLVEFAGLLDLLHDLGIASRPIRIGHGLNCPIRTKEDPNLEVIFYQFFNNFLQLGIIADKIYLKGIL